MKRNILLLAFAVFAAVQAAAQTYGKMWKQAMAFDGKDQPRSELAVLQKIAAKASAAKDYGQLLTAEMYQTMLWDEISTDSLSPAVARMERQAATASDPILRAVWYAVLGKMYREYPNEINTAGDDTETTPEDLVKRNKTLSTKYFNMAMEQPELLAKHYSTEYTPLTLKGMDGSSFQNDMLHLVGFEADSKDAYSQMYRYYAKQGNRAAACLCAFEIVMKERQEDVRLVRKSKYLNTLDSLIQVYQDLPEAGEIAVEHFRFLEGATDAAPADKLNYIDYALSRWGGWSRMNVLRNARKRLTWPMFDFIDMPAVLLPGKNRWVQLQVRNLQTLKITVSRINITADNHYDVNDASTYKKLMKKTSPLQQKDISLQFYGHPEYELLKDSFQLGALPLGTYLMEITSDNVDVQPCRQLFYVSDLALMGQQLPDDTQRYVVVSATSGQPVKGATILLYDEKENEKGKTVRTENARLITDENGEAYCKKVRGEVLVSTLADKYTPAKYSYLSHSRYFEPKDVQTHCQLYTDRAIYRPGQTVHATALVFLNEKGADAKVPSETRTVKLQLRDANRKTVAETEVCTDEYGTASADFQLPEGGLTGQYSVHANVGSANCYFRVEEYKRPTFKISFPEVNKKYTWGDTVVVKATARTFAGVPVQGAKVEYSVSRRNAFWWVGSRSGRQQLLKSQGITAMDGTFEVEIPLVPKDVENTGNVADFMREASFFDFEVEAVVTDLSGESQEGSMSLPLGTRSAVLSINLPQRILRDSLRTLCFDYRNSAGIKISAPVRYRIDQGVWYTTDSNMSVEVSQTADSVIWHSGVHQLEAVCGSDSLRQKFTVFSMQDSNPAESVAHWCYQSAKQFPSDGTPVYLQVGSSENGVHIVYSIIAGNQLLEKGTWELGDSIVTLPFCYKPEYASGIVLNYCFVKDGKSYTNMMAISRPQPDKKLCMAWKTFRNRLTPGQKEEWTLHITTPDGKPANAQLMGVLYDKALDKLQSHQWNLSLGLYSNMPNCYWNSSLQDQNFLNGLGSTSSDKYYEEAELEVDHFDKSLFERNFVAGQLYSVQNRMENRSLAPARMVKSQKVALGGTSLMAKAQFAGTEGVASVAEEVEDVAENKTLDNVQMRENLNETAFFYPALQSDANGNVVIKFTLPQSLTTWRFMGLVHDREMRNALISDEVVAQKTVMVQPNMPRFVREGDKAYVAVKVFNTSNKKVNGSLRMQMTDSGTDRMVWQKVKNYTVEANGTVTVEFAITGIKAGLYVNKVVATGSGYSDGEQHWLPVLSSSELVTNTLPFTLMESGAKNFNLSHLYEVKDGTQSKNAANAKITIEYTNRPEWLMLQALPTLSQADDDNAISLMSAVYSNCIAQHIMRTSPAIKQVVELWKKEISNGGTSLQSQLEKNQELKCLVLDETPWVMEADRESEQKSRLVNYFDESQNAQRLSMQLAKLKNLQQSDGSFAWWKGMPGSRYITTEVAEMMARLNSMVGAQANMAPMFNLALDYLQKQTAREVKKLRKEEKEKRSVIPSEQTVNYLYIMALDGRKLGASAASDQDYLIKKIADNCREFTIYGKAVAAVVLARNNQQQKAAEFLQSIQEYSVSKQDMGRWFDTSKALYSWFDYKIPTQVAAIEAMQLTGKGSMQKEICEMKLWLLQQKRTQMWSTPVNTVNAVYAFLNGNEQNLNVGDNDASFKLDGQNLQLSKATVALGYVKVVKQGKARTLTIDKKSAGISWGAAYVQVMQDVNEMNSMASGIKVTRIVEYPQNVKVGDKVKVILVITADRDYDFVQVMDKRAACLEPVAQLSGYQWSQGCYVAPKDHATAFFFHNLAKGKHVLETEYYVDRNGEYQSGSCVAQCCYSPEFTGRAQSYKITVK